MSPYSLYDKSCRFYKSVLSKMNRLKNVKEQSQNALFTLLQSNPDSENDICLAILYFYNRCGLGYFVHYDKKQLQIITHIKNHTYNIYMQRICDFLKNIKAHFMKKNPQKRN